MNISLKVLPYLVYSPLKSLKTFFINSFGSNKIYSYFFEKCIMNYNINDEIIVISTNEKKRIKEIELIDGIEILYTYDNCSYANFQTAKINSLEIENLHQLICNSTHYQIQREKTIKACTLWVKETENFYRQTFKKKKKYWIF